MATLDAIQDQRGDLAGSSELNPFEGEVLSILLLEGPVEFDKHGERTLCELFGYPNSTAERLYRALRQLIKLGLVRQLDGSRNAMRSPKKLSFSRKNSVTVYQAV